MGAQSLQTSHSGISHNAVAAGRKPAKIMLVDDSIVARSILERILENAGGFSIIASVATANDALTALDDHLPDVIVLDIDMPGMSGITALPLILNKAMGARVLILSANCEEGGPAAIEALARGAADTLVKPGRGTFAGSFATVLVDRLHTLVNMKGRLYPAVLSPVAPPAVLNLNAHSGGVAAIGIGASTGGIMAINSFLGALPADVLCPIMVTQHLPGAFMPFFAEQLKRLVQRPVLVAADGMQVLEGHIYLAPGDGHITLSGVASRGHIMIDRTAAASGATPSVDPMLESLARRYGQSACGVMLSGMGRDGLEGARKLVSAGGLMLAQDLESCVVWGMPGAVVRDGIAASVHDPATLALIVAQSYFRQSTDE